MNHRLLLTTVFGFFLAFSAQAQRPLFRPQVHEIGIQLGEAHQIPALSAGYANGMGLGANVVNGIWYKYHITYQHGIRAGAAYRTAQFDYPDGRNRFVSYEATRRDIDGFLGYELSFPAGRITLTGALDLAVSRSSSEELGIEEGPVLIEYRNDPALWRVGGRGALGFHYFFTPYTSFTLEAGPYYQRAMGTGTTDQPFTLFPEQEFGFRAVAMLSFHFKQMKKRCTCPKH